MITHQITKLAFATFLCNWLNAQGKVVAPPLKLNFDVLIEEFNLTGQFTLVHWQARPKNLRRWGIYCATSDHYHSCEYERLRFTESAALQALQVDESVIKTVPTSVLYLPSTQVLFEDDHVFVRGI